MFQSPQETIKDFLDDNRSEIFQKLDWTLTQIQFEQALIHARNGELDIAENILRTNIEENADPNNLDLLARILARQGKVDQARSLWEKVLTINPGHKSAQDALEYLSSKAPYRTRIIYTTGKALIGIVVVTIITFLFFQVKGLNQITQQTLLEVQQLKLTPVTIYNSVQNPITVSDLNNLSKKEDVQAISTKIDILASLIQPTLTPSSEFISQINISIDGIHSIKIDNSLEIVFENGIFLYERRISDEGKKLLLELGSQLEPYASVIQIEVYGFTDSSESRFTDLGMQRALSVVNFLIANTRLPAELFSVRSSHGLNSPFPNNNQTNRIKNRTAILIIHGDNR